MKSINLPADVGDLIKEYKQARRAASQWSAIEKGLRARLASILEVAGYTLDAHNLAAERVDALAGDTVFEVRPTPTTKLDQTMLKKRYPDVYNECQKRTTSYRIVMPDPEGTESGSVASVADEE